MSEIMSNDPEVDLQNLTDGFEVSAYVLANGEIIEKSAVPSPTKNSKNRASNSIDLDEDDFGEQYANGTVYRPPLNLKNLSEFSMDSIYHLRCIDQKSQDTFSGYKVTRTGAPLSNESKKTPQGNVLQNFLDNCTFNEVTFIEFVKQIYTDYQTYGFCVFELIPDRGGRLSKLNRLHPETCRIVRNLSSVKDSDQRYVMQVVNRHERVFKIYDPSEKLMLRQEPNTKRPMTEVVVIRNFHVSGGKYGIPKWVPALKAIIGNDKVAEYNINFFDNQAVPRFAVLVKGGNLSDESKKEIKSYFKHDLKGNKNAHKTLMLTTQSADCEIKLVPLANESKDGDFRYYRKDNRDEIISAHGVPPQRVQVFDSGGNANSSKGDSYEADKSYKYSTIVPAQIKFAEIFNSVFQHRLNVANYIIEFNDLDIGERKDQADTLKITSAAHEKYYNAGILTVDEIRASMGYKPFKDTDVDDEVKRWASTPKPIYLLQRQREEELYSNLQQNQEQEQSQKENELAENNLNEDENTSSRVMQRPNDFNDKSTQVKERNAVSKLASLSLNDVLEKMNSSISEIKDLIEEGH